MSSSSLSPPVRVLLRFLLTIFLVWAMASIFPDYVEIDGGFTAYVIIGALLTLLNILVRPVLALLTLPLKLFATILALILSNAAFLWITMQISSKLDPMLVTFSIEGGAWGWIVVALILGISNWIFREILR